MGHSLDSFQELKMKGKNDEIGLCYSGPFLFHEETVFIILLLWPRNCLRGVSGFQSVQSFSALCAMMSLCWEWISEQGPCEMQLCAPSLVPQTQFYDWIMLTTHAGVDVTCSAELELFCLLRVRRFKKESLKERAQCESMLKHYFQCRVAEEAAQLSKVGSYMSVISEDKAVAGFSQTPAH